MNPSPRPVRASSHEHPTLAGQIRSLAPAEAAALVERAVPAEAVEALLQVNPAMVQSILRELEPGPRRLPRYIARSATATRSAAARPSVGDVAIPTATPTPASRRPPSKFGCPAAAARPAMPAGPVNRSRTAAAVPT